MNLQNIVADAVGGFSIGLVWGLKDPSYNVQRALEFIEAVPEDKRKEFGIKTATPEVVTYIKNRVFSSAVAVPYVLGGVYSIAASVLCQTPFSENIIATVPSTYLGYFVGKGVRLFRDRKERRQIRTLKQILQDPDNAEKYALSEKQRETIENCLSGIEQDVLNENKDANKFVGYVAKMYGTLIENPGPYTKIILDRNMIKTKRVVERANIRRELKDFYEADFLEGVPEQFKPVFQKFEKEFVKSVVVEQPSEPKLKIFVKEGDEFYVMTVDFDRLRIIRQDNTPYGRVDSGGRHINLSERVSWNGDYSELGDRFLKERQGYTMMLMNLPEGYPEEDRNQIATAGFIEAYSSYLRKKDIEREKSGK